MTSREQLEEVGVLGSSDPITRSYDDFLYCQRHGDDDALGLTPRLAFFVWKICGGLDFE